MHPKYYYRMATARPVCQDRKEVEKFIKFLAQKMVQVVVQSRLGEKLKTKSKPYSSGSDWFNLSITDLPEVLAETKKAMASQIPVVGYGLCVEISLKTAEGDTMVLETWNLQMLDTSDGPLRVTAIYNRMSLLLKSLITVTRVTPAYKLSMLQGSGSFVICYRVYMGDSEYQNLGESYQTVRVGQVGTHLGTLVLSVVYRTQLTISPQRTVSKDCPFLVKSDHFKPDFSPQCQRCLSQVPCHGDARTDTEEGLTAREDCGLPVIPCHPASLGCNFRNGDYKAQQQIKKEWDASPLGTWDKRISFSNSKKVGAFAGEQTNTDDNPDYLMPDAPFISLLQPASCKEAGDIKNENKCISNSTKDNLNNIINNNKNNDEKDKANFPRSSDVDLCCNDGANDLENSTASSASGPGDFVLVELKPPFANADGTITDLGTFYRDCQSAPPLISFSNQPSLADQVGDLANQLAAFETSQPEFDDFVESLNQEEVIK